MAILKQTACSILAMPLQVLHRDAKLTNLQAVVDVLIPGKG
jgi:hypothetical protein